MTLERRTVLRWLALSGGAALLSRCRGGEERTSRASNGYKVIVVGAGMAGLACARSLKRRGFEVLVLEARDRLGGRVYTDRSLGFPVERGANWIEGERGNPIARIAADSRIKTVVDESEGAFYDFDGSRLGADRVARLEAVREGLEELAEEASEELVGDVAIEAAVRRQLRGESLDAFDRRAVDFAMAAIEIDLAGGLEHASLAQAGEGDGFGGDSLFLPDGYDRVALAVAEDLDVRLGALAQQIRVRREGVEVTTSSDRFEAHSAVVTVPLGVLKAGAIEFVPGLSKRKREAIARLDMGTLNKTILAFERAFWPSDAGTFFYLSSHRGEFPQIVDWHAFSGQPALILFQGGTFAKRAEKWSDRESVDRAMKIVRACFGTSSPDPVGYLVQRWNADRYTLGSYSFLPTGASPGDRDALAEPEGDRLYFCGEATSRDYPATVHGAFLSGEREAARIAEVAGVD